MASGNVMVAYYGGQYYSRKKIRNYLQPFGSLFSAMLYIRLDLSSVLPPMKLLTRDSFLILEDLAQDPPFLLGQEINIPNNVPEDLIINDEDTSAGPTYATEEPSLF